jgi:hypothetical protein
MVRKGVRVETRDDDKVTRRLANEGKKTTHRYDWDLETRVGELEGDIWLDLGWKREGKWRFLSHSSREEKVRVNLPTQGLSTSDPWVYGCSLGFWTGNMRILLGVWSWNIVYHSVLGRNDWRTQQRGNEILNLQHL